MSGIYQKNVNSESVAAPSAGRTLISVNETGELFTKDSSGNVSITQPKFVTVQTSRTLDVFALFDAVLEDPFDIESWKASYAISEVDGSVLNGVYETSGDFSTETSYANLVGLTPSDDGTYKETLFSAAYFTPDSSEGILSALWDTSNVKLGGTFNAEWTYSYEEDASATGSDPKYLHDFRLIVDSLQILGYVVINADDSESHNFIIDSATGV